MKHTSIITSQQAQEESHVYMLSQLYVYVYLPLLTSHVIVTYFILFIFPHYVLH